MVLGPNQTEQLHIEDEEPGFVIDTSAFIKLDPYYLDVFPSLWNAIEELINQGRLISPQEVLIEIHEFYDDGWNKWVKQHKKMFLDKKETQLHASQIQNWYPGLTNKDGTKTDADYYVIGLAKYMGNGWTVVTDESRKRANLRIPHVCEKMKIPCVDLHNFFKKCKWKY